MSTSYDPTTTGSDSILAYLQELLLTAALLGERLPGARRPLRLLKGGLREIPSRIITSNLAAALRLDELPQRLDLLSLEQLTLDEHLLIDGEISFLAFRPAVWHADRVELSMVVGGMQRANGDWQCREIGHVNAEFCKVGGRWAALTEPHVFLAPDY
jgi:hypothetical protein